MVPSTLPWQLPSPGRLPSQFERPLTPDLESITKLSTRTSEGLAFSPSQTPPPPIQLSQLQQVLETLRLQGLLPEPESTMEPSTSTSEALQTTPSLTTQDQGRLEPLQVPMTPRPPSESTPPRPESPAIPDTADIGRLQLETLQLELSEPQQLLSQTEVPPITNKRPVIPHTLPVSLPAGSLPYAVLTSSHFQNVVKFTAGLTKLRSLPITTLKSILLQQGRYGRQVDPTVFSPLAI